MVTFAVFWCSLGRSRSRTGCPTSWTSTRVRCRLAFATERLRSLVLRRHAELDAAIERRDWFDPWVFELDDDSGTQAVYPWVAGFATALEHFPAPMRSASRALTEPLALLYRHLDPDDLEDADELLEEIESLEPAANLTEAVEELVRATLLLADITRPRRTVARRGRDALARR